jgi:acyl carrier protein
VEYSNQINSALRQFVLDHFPSARRRPLADTEPLLESGIIDSLGILDVVAFIEAEFKFTVDDEELTPENFRTITNMCGYVSKKLNGHVDPRL